MASFQSLCRLFKNFMFPVYLMHLSTSKILKYRVVNDTRTLQIWYNRHFTDMIQLVLSTGGFYFSRTYDLSHSAQWLAENVTPLFKRVPMMDRVRNIFANPL